MIAILSDAGPAGEERPHRAEMISIAGVFGRGRRKNAHAPVSLHIRSDEARDHFSRLDRIEPTEPHGHGWEHGRLVHASVIWIDGKGENRFLGQPKARVEASS